MNLKWRVYCTFLSRLVCYITQFDGVLYMSVLLRNELLAFGTGNLTRLGLLY